MVKGNAVSGCAREHLPRRLGARASWQCKLCPRMVASGSQRHMPDLPHLPCLQKLLEEVQKLKAGDTTFQQVGGWVRILRCSAWAAAPGCLHARASWQCKLCPIMVEAAARGTCPTSHTCRARLPACLHLVQKLQENVQKLLNWQERIVGITAVASLIVTYLMRHQIMG